jgi:hypothetical protein
MSKVIPNPITNPSGKTDPMAGVPIEFRVRAECNKATNPECKYSDGYIATGTGKDFTTPPAVGAQIKDEFCPNCKTPMLIAEVLGIVRPNGGYRRTL